MTCPPRACTRKLLRQLSWGIGEHKGTVNLAILHRACLGKYPESPFREEFLTVRLPAIAARKTAAGDTEGRR